MRDSLPSRTMRQFFACTALFALTFPALAPCSAQNIRGSLCGSVVDSTGGRVARANVTVRSADSSTRWELQTDREGAFQAAGLMPGRYVVSVAAPGFATARSDVTISIDTTQEITVTLNPAPVEQTVRVQSVASSIATQAINTTSAVHQGIVTKQDLETLPLAARSFANIAYLVPGTEPVEPSDPTKARITAVSFGGSSGLNVELSVDGGDNSDDYIGGFLQNFSPDAIQEFAVRTSQEDADTGRTTAGSVVITTKRGTDQWHGSGAFYERAAALNARFPIDNPAPNPKQPFSRQNYVGTLGGPIQRQKLWFFTSLEFVRENASIAYSPASTAQFNALASLAAAGLIPGVNSIAVPAIVPVPFLDYLGLTRLDWEQSAKSQWFLRAAIDNYSTQNSLVQQATLPSTGATERSNYMNLVLNEHYSFSPTWLGLFTFDASGLHLSEQRNANFGYALAFPFSSTFQTISGYETFGDNQFVTPITAFPVVRTQEKYQFRYDVSHATGTHSPRFGVSFIHEPVLSGALALPETIYQYPQDPSYYAANPSQFYAAANCSPPPNPASGIICAPGSGGTGSFSQNVQRLGLYAEDSWKATPRLMVNYGLRWDTTFGLFAAESHSQFSNPAIATLQALEIPLIAGAPQDYRKQFGPRLGLVYAVGEERTTVLRSGFGLFYNDLAQNGWVQALTAQGTPSHGPCINPGDPGCIPGAAFGGQGALIDPHYHTPYALHATAGVEHAFSANWLVSVDFTHEEGNHAYRAYQYDAGYTLLSPLFPATDLTEQMYYVPNLSVYRTDNRSSYNGLSLHLQGSVARRFSLIANYTLSKAQTWGCVLGELFDYVNGVCNPLNAFAKGDYGPSGEDVRDRFVLAGTIYAPWGFEVTTLFQAESARPFTMTTPADVNGLGNTSDDRAVINGVQTTLDEFRGTPYIQMDLRVARPIRLGERWTAMPFIEFFNLFNRNNPGANYVTNLAALPNPVNSLTNATAICTNPPACTAYVPITSLNQLRVPAGALGDFFGPGTTVGIPFAAQVGFRLDF
jgi:hypothetical protein